MFPFAQFGGLLLSVVVVTAAAVPAGQLQKTPANNMFPSGRTMAGKSRSPLTAMAIRKFM